MQGSKSHLDLWFIFFYLKGILIILLCILVVYNFLYLIKYEIENK